jgi:excisionase family DNA binding protein
VAEPADTESADMLAEPAPGHGDPIWGQVLTAAYPPVLTTAQAAELLHVHVEYLRKMVREDRIPAHRFPGGREMRFMLDELLAWVRAQPGHDRSPGAEERGAEERGAEERAGARIDG